MHHLCISMVHGLVPTVFPKKYFFQHLFNSEQTELFFYKVLLFMFFSINKVTFLGYISIDYIKEAIQLAFCCCCCLDLNFNREVNSQF